MYGQILIVDKLVLEEMIYLIGGLTKKISIILFQ